MPLWHGLQTRTRRHMYLPWLYSRELQWGKPQSQNPNWWCCHPHWNLKSKKKKNTITDTNIRKSVGCSTLRNNSLEEDLWHYWHMPEKATGIDVAAAVTVEIPTAPLTVSFMISGDSKTTSCWPKAAASPTEMGATATVVVVANGLRVHNCHR